MADLKEVEPHLLPNHLLQRLSRAFSNHARQEPSIARTEQEQRPGNSDASREDGTQMASSEAHEEGEDVGLKQTIEGLTSILSRLSATSSTLKEQLDTELAESTTNARERLEAIANEIINEYIPRMIEAKAQVFDESLDAALEELRSKWTTSLKEEIRRCVRDFIWADIKRSPKGIEWLEKKVMELEARLDYWTKQLKGLQLHQVSAESANDKARICALEIEIAETNMRNCRLESEMAVFKGKTAGLEQKNAELEAEVWACKERQQQIIETMGRMTANFITYQERANDLGGQELDILLARPL